MVSCASCSLCHCLRSFIFGLSHLTPHHRSRSGISRRTFHLACGNCRHSDWFYQGCVKLSSRQVSASQSCCILKGELNPEKNVGLNEYLREIKFCTGQERVDVVQRKKIFIDKNHYLFTYFKNCVLREDGSSYRRYYIVIYATSAFTKTLYENSFERKPRDQR